MDSHVRVFSDKYCIDVLILKYLARYESQMDKNPASLQTSVSYLVSFLLQMKELISFSPLSWGGRVRQGHKDGVGRESESNQFPLY